VPELPAEKHNDGIRFSRNEPQQKHVAAATVVAFEDGVAKGTVLVQGDFLVLGADEMVYDVCP
jgi:hypothetical protein